LLLSLVLIIINHIINAVHVTAFCVVVINVFHRLSDHGIWRGTHKASLILAMTAKRLRKTYKLIGSTLKNSKDPLA
jgi:hypothetical protein